MTSTARAHLTERTRPTLTIFIRERAWALTVWVSMTIWIVALYAVVRDNYLTFRIGRFDLGNMVQAVWSTTRGRPFETTEGATGEQVNRLGVHVDPFLGLLAPLWAVWPSPLALALAQIVVVSTGALPVFWLGRRHFGSEQAAGVLALGYLAYPWVLTSAGSAIHPVTFAIPLLLFGIWFLDADRLLPFVLVAVLVMSTGELMGLPIAGLGVWYALARRRRAAGAVIAIVGFAWSFVAVYLVVPAVRGDTSHYYGFFDEIGGSPEGIVKTLVTDPGAVLGALLQVPDLAYVLWLTVPLCGLFLLSPGLAALALPQLLVNGLSDFPSMTDPRYHSVAAVIPFLIAATVLGIARLRASRHTLAASCVVVSSILVALVVGPWPLLVGITPLGARTPLQAAHVEALREAISLVPPAAAVTTSNVAGAHLSARKSIYSVPVLGDATWALLDLDDPWATTPGSPLLHNHPAQVRVLARRLGGDRSWRKVFERDGVLVFRKLSG